MTYVADGLRVVVAGSCCGHDVLLECQTAVKHDTERLHLISHREIDASYRYWRYAGVTVRSWFAVPMISASDLSGFSCSPFCIYHCLTSLVHAARTNENTQIKSALLYKTRRKQHKQNTDYKLQMIHDNTCLKTFCHFINCHTVNQLFTSKGADNLLPLAAFLFHAKPKYTHTHDYCNLKKLDI